MTQDQTQQARNMPVTIHAQYVRDMSFENPNAPLILRPDAGQPSMDLSINIGLREINDAEIPGMYEVSLHLRADARRGQTAAFIAEVDYAAAVSVGQEVPPEAMHPLLMIEIPRLIFPYARQILSDMSRQGAFPALMIAPVDFQALYMQKFAEETTGQARKSA